MSEMSDGFRIGANVIPRGARKTIDLPVSVLSDHTHVNLSAHIVHGREPGPTVFVSAAIHGDEVNGVEIVRRVLRAPALDQLRGTLIAVPIVNTFGFINRSRYLPDRRDLNRSFPGSVSGSLTARLAELFLREIVHRADVGIDLHSAAIHRTNLPQIRISPNSKRAAKLAEAFGAPIVITSKVRDGSLRKVARDASVDVLVFEGGEGLRFDELSARAGSAGVIRVLEALEMLPAGEVDPLQTKPIRSRGSHWRRAPAGGLLRTFKTIGETVAADDLLGAISDPFGDVEEEVRADVSGLIIGRSNLPIVNEGDALFHIAEVAKPHEAGAAVETLTEQANDDPMFDEDEII